MTKFEIYKDTAGYYRWRLKAANGEKVAASEGYTTKASAITSARNVQSWAASANIYDLT